MNSMDTPRPAIRTQLGIVLIILGFISPLFALLVPLLNLDSTQTGALTAFLLVGAPEIGLIVGGIFAGKEGVLLVKNKILALFGLKTKDDISRARYYFALFLLLGWILLSAILSYVTATDSLPLVKDYGRWVLFAADVMLVVAVFFVGGDPLIRKFAAIFEWESGGDAEKQA